jgi:hypothetical protein
VREVSLPWLEEWAKHITKSKNRVAMKNVFLLIFLSSTALHILAILSLIGAGLET